MGCGASRENDKEIKYKMKWVKLSDYDSFFSKAEEVLKTAEDIRGGFEDSQETMYEIVCIQFLKKQPTLKDALDVWLWSLSASNGGDIKQCKISFDKEAPYVDCDVGRALAPCYNFKEQFRTYVKTAIEGIKGLPDLIKNLADLVSEANKLKDSAKDSIKNSGLGFVDQGKALGAIAKNTVTLAKGLTKVKNLQPILVEASNNIKELINEFKKMVDTADETGKKALEKNYTLPSDIMEHIHPGEKYTAKEIRQMKQETEQKQKKKEEKQKKKNEKAAKKQKKKKEEDGDKKKKSED